MDRAESFVSTYLANRFPGSDRVVHEPDGNVPPDFLVDGRIAVEVRRLNEHPLDGVPRPLVETEIPFARLVRQIAAGFSSDAKRTLLIYVEFRRPLPSPKDLGIAAKGYFERLLAAPDPVGMTHVASPNLTMKCLRVSMGTGRAFSFAWVDLDGGGSPLPVLRRNLHLVVAEKSRKTHPFRTKYPEWWLALVDYVSFGRDDYERTDIRDYLAIQHDWDCILLIDPLDVEVVLEL